MDQKLKFSADQILANRLVIVYAKSGLGKTSLLNAGVAWRLRNANCLPLMVRVNDTVHGALASVYDGMREAAERQNIEYQPGQSDSLWDFFETSEFWRGDILLRPCLIVDQFEELFTLQSSQHRTDFIAELGFLLRGARPPGSRLLEAALPIRLRRSRSYSRFARIISASLRKPRQYSQDLGLSI